MRTPFAVLVTLALTISSLQSWAADETLPRVPDGFTIAPAASSPLVQHPVMAGFDDRGRLFVAETAGRNLRAPDLEQELPNFVRMLEDTDGDGRFDASTIFADKMTFPMGAVWYRGALYVAAPPSIWKLEDTDDDGVADRRTELVDKFGFSGNAASIHGCFLGPCGRIYWADGRHGFDFADGRKGKASGIFSCRPDGSDVELFAGGGMDNPVEVDFLPTGEMLGTANIMLSQPRVDVLVHWIDGGAYPRFDQENVTAELKKTGDLLPPMTELGHVAVSGMMRYRSDQFGSQYKDNIFISIFNTHKIIRSVVERSGATFTTRQEDFLVSQSIDFHPTDVLEDADGSLLVIDTGGWFRIGCPTSQVAKPEIRGAIYRIRKTGAHKLADPRGLKLGFNKMSAEQAVEYLDDPRPVVREKAIEALARQGAKAIPVLKDVLLAEEETGVVKINGVARPVISKVHPPAVRRRAVWALARITDENPQVYIAAALKDGSEPVKLAAAHALATRGSADSASIAELAKLVVSGSPPLRREAATALGRIGGPTFGRCPGRALSTVDGTTVLAALIDSLRAGVTDRYLEHALIYALIRIDDATGTAEYLNDPSPHVRRAALIALDQMDSARLTRGQVIPLLDTDDPDLQKEALRIIGSREGWAGETLALLRGWLHENELAAEREAVLRGFLLAQSKDRGIQRLMSDALNRPTASEPLRLLLLDVVYRSPAPELSDVLIASLQRGIVLGSPAVRLQSIRIVHDRGLTSFDRQLRRMAGEEKQPPDVRVEALSTIAPRIDSLTGEEFDFLLGRLDEKVEPLSRLAAAQALAEAPLGGWQLIQLSGSFDKAGPLAVPVLARAFSHSTDEEVGLAFVASLDKSAAAANVSADELSRSLEAYPNSVQEAGRRLLKRLGVDLQQQKRRLAELAPLADDGDAERGRHVFFGKKAACAGCHTVAGEGGKVGPDLSRIGNIRTAGDLIEAIAFPSSSFARGYRSYTILTEQGRVYTGVISRQSAETLYLRTAELAEIRIPRDAIEEMRESRTSVMPKGMDETLSTEELRDLIAFLRSRK